jgi:response regulator RpfG family c-di-GMP phosphodiesterase
MRQNVLVVAEHAETRESLAVLLRSEGITVSLATGAADAVRVLRSTPVDTALVVSQGPDLGAERLRARILHESPRCRVLPLSRRVTLLDRKRVARFGIGDYGMEERELLALVASRHGAEDRAGPLPDKGVLSLLEVVDVLVGLLELGDKHFAGSSHRAMQLARAVSEEMRLPDEMLTEVVLATLVRDVGKYGIDPAVFRAPGRLNPEQSAKMQEHVAAGFRLLEHIEFPWRVLAVIRHHHERYDGLGYPDGLRGPEIPLGARILSVVDAYTAMLSDRPHRQPLSSDAALQEIERQAGSQFDPEVVEIFIRAVSERHRPLAVDQRPRVILASRDGDFVRPLAVRLQNEGLEVHAEADLQDAMLRLIENPPHLILADLEEDEERAFDFLRILREDDGLAKVPFVYLVPRFELPQAVRVLRHGVDDCLVKTDDLVLLVARIRNIMIRETRRQSGTDEPRRRGIQGQLENLALPDICQMLHLGLKTACVSLASGERRGRIWFDQGTVVHAESDDESGVGALNEFLRWKAGEFTIQHGIAADQVTLEGDTMLLVMEGLRLLDEDTAQTAGSAKA